MHNGPRRAALALAHEFGRADVDRFLSEIDSRQVTEWFAYFRVVDVERDLKRK